MSLAAEIPERPRARPGQGRLEIRMVAGQSAVTSVWAASPLKILTPRPRGRAVWAYFSSLGGGLVAGDETEVDLELGEGARCFASTQASTKIYRNPDSRPCGHRLKAALGEGSLLVWAPDPMQAFAGSSYAQRQEFYLQPDAGLVVVDWLCSGRSANGERWAFNRFQSRNEVFLGGERKFIDSLLLDPENGPLDHPQRMGRFNCLALVLLMGDSLGAASARIFECISQQPVHCRASMSCSASPIAHGALLRIAGERVEDVSREIHRHLAFLADLLQDDPWSRKW